MFNRHTEHFVCVTYYNEDKVMLSRTIHSLFENITDIYNLKKTNFWNNGGISWQKMVVCIVMDGIEACDDTALDVLATMGVYQDGIMRRSVDGAPVTAHVVGGYSHSANEYPLLTGFGLIQFECTTQLSVSGDQRLWRPMDDGPMTLPPVQLMLCIKTQNAGKINSYRWIYNAFGRILNPEIVSNIDTGTYLKPRALLSLREAFYNDKDLGAACGALHVDLGKNYLGLLNPLIATQNFEYKVTV